MKNISISLFFLCLFLFGKYDITRHKKDKSKIEKPNVIFILTGQWRAAYLGKWHLDGHGRKVHKHLYKIQSA